MQREKVLSIIPIAARSVAWGFLYPAHAYDAPPNKYSRVLGTGKNICGQNPRQVERALEVRFK
jgi:hypothetical protein